MSAGGRGSSSPAPWGRVVCLAGGVGGARLVDGLVQCLGPEQLTVVVNTGDDLTHWGLQICPDLDTVMYTLAGLAPVDRGWGIEGETFAALGMMRSLGGPDWFQLGDRDLAVHLRRSERLAMGLSLSEVTGELCRALGVTHPVLPMSDTPRPTIIHTEEHGVLTFQEWLVRHRGGPTVSRVVLAGAHDAPAPGVLEAIEAAELVVLAPSNPYVSIDPILALAGVREALLGVPVVALSPIVHGAAVKGPLAGMIRSLSGREPCPEAVCDHYGGLVDALVVEQGDGGEIDWLPVLETQTVMGGREDRTRLAREVLDFAAARLRDAR